MVLRGLLLALLLLVGSGLAAPALAHKDHDREKAALATGSEATNLTVAHPMSRQVHDAVKDDLAQLEAEAAQPWHARLLDWVGRLHPFAVHFPLALFPIVWIALMLDRRRENSDPLIRSMVIVAGASAAVAAILGWLNGGFVLADADPILLWHRWVGTALGVAGAALAVWIWRAAATAHSKAVIWALGLFTFILLAQGWLGGALIHGMDHLNW